MNRTPLNIIPLLAAATLMLAACSSDDDATAEQPRRTFSVSVSEQPLQTDDPVAARLTRSDITTIDNLTAFTISDYHNNARADYTVTKSGTGWTVTPNTWPAEGNSELVTFYAYTSGTFYLNNGSPYVHFDIDENASTQHDLLVATATKSYSDCGGTVPLTFSHACAALQFNVKMSNTLSTQLNTTLTVNSIVLRNVSNKGRYCYTGGWNNVESSAYYTLTNGDMEMSTTLKPLSSNYLFVIPQQREANGTEGTYLDIAYTYSGQSQSSCTIPLAPNWEAGKLYTININLGTSLIK